MEIRFIFFPSTKLLSKTETETDRDRERAFRRRRKKGDFDALSLSSKALSHSHFSSFSTAPFFTRALMMMMFFYSDASDAFTRNTRLDNKNQVLGCPTLILKSFFLPLFFFSFFSSKGNKSGASCARFV